MKSTLEIQGHYTDYFGFPDNRVEKLCKLRKPKKLSLVKKGSAINTPMEEMGDPSNSKSMSVAYIGEHRDHPNITDVQENVRKSLGKLDKRLANKLQGTKVVFFSPGKLAESHFSTLPSGQEYRHKYNYSTSDKSDIKGLNFSHDLNLIHMPIDKDNEKEPINIHALFHEFGHQLYHNLKPSLKSQDIKEAEDKLYNAYKNTGLKNYSPEIYKTPSSVANELLADLTSSVFQLHALKGYSLENAVHTYLGALKKGERYSGLHEAAKHFYENVLLKGLK